MERNDMENTTTDAVVGLLRENAELRNRVEELNRALLAAEHAWACHRDGSVCEDGCDAAALPVHVRA